MRKRTSRRSEILRQNPYFLYNKYHSSNLRGIPDMKAFTAVDREMKLISWKNTKYNATKNLDKGVHFFADDQDFERVYNKPEPAAKKLAQYKYILTPDFSMYTDMPLVVQENNVFRNRWCGAFWQQDCGLDFVIPTVCWSTPESYEFAFLGLEKGTAVALSTIGTNNKETKSLFLAGYNELIRQVEPIAIYCYGTPFTEMQGEIITIPYIFDDFKKMIAGGMKNGWTW